MNTVIRSLTAGVLLIAAGCATDDVAQSTAAATATPSLADSQAEADAAREQAQRAIADAEAFRARESAIEDHDPVAEAAEAVRMERLSTPVADLAGNVGVAVSTALDRAKQAEAAARGLVGKAGASGVPEIRKQASQLMTRAGLLTRQAGKAQRDLAQAAAAQDGAQLVALEEGAAQIAAACTDLFEEAADLSTRAEAAAAARAVIEAQPTPAEVEVAAEAIVDEASKEFWMSTYESDEMVAVMETNKGTIVLEFFPDVAPGHVKNFVDLAQKGFYDGLLFHRVIPGFMIQGGCPDGNGTGGPGYKIDAEFNDRPHTRGTLSMARSQHPDSAGSQFFICNATAPHLDGNYTVFGSVLSGWEAIDALTAVGSSSGATSERVLMEKVTIRPRSADDIKVAE